MSLSSGSRLGQYEILSLLGAGGMGEVYRARDTRLRRDVALKILPAAFAADPDRRARFSREAQLLASLNHPNIAAVYGVEETGDVTALAMELVEGDTLADRVERGPIPLDETLPIARQIAEALETAHDQGIVHRDLKPANVKVKSDGTVKVLDFGLAKAFAPAESGPGVSQMTQSPTVTSPAMTQAGIILGTAAYMSPEQARGRPVDRRADIWACGCVLYEMLTGRRAFDEGESISDTIAAVLKNEPDWSALPLDTPAVVRKLLRRSLEKDVRKRLPHIGIARLELDDPPDQQSRESRPPRNARWRLGVAFAATAIASAAIAVTAMLLATNRASGPTSASVIRFSLDTGVTVLSRRVIALSPDGSKLAYITNDGSSLFVRRLAEREARRVSLGNPNPNISDPVFSPDGESIAYHSLTEQSLRKIAIAGGVSTLLCPNVSPPFGISWTGDQIFVGRGTAGVWRVNAAGGDCESLPNFKQDETVDGPRLLPDGDHLLLTVTRSRDLDRWDRADIVVHSLKTGERKTVVEGGSDARYLPTGHLLYASGGIAFIVPFDPAENAVRGRTTPVIDGVRRAAGGITAAAHISVSDTGSLAYIPGPSTTTIVRAQLGLLDRSGSVSFAAISPGTYETPRVSPDGRFVAFAGTAQNDRHIWICALNGESAQRKLTLQGQNRLPVWSPDSRDVVFQSDREGDLAVFRQRVDGIGSPQRVTRPGAGESHAPDSWAPDGSRLLLTVGKGQDLRLATFTFATATLAEWPGVTSQIPFAAAFSHDGRWVAYQSGVAGANGVYVQSFPALDARHLISSGNSHHPQWSHDDRELFFIPARAQPVVVRISMQPDFSFTNPVPLAGSRWAEGGPGTQRSFDVVPGSGKIVGFFAPESQEAARLEFVLNWFEELKRLSPVP